MIIKEQDFVLTQHNDYDRFDLELLYVVNAKDPEKRREEFKDAGYSMTLETCMHKVINFRISRRKETVTLKEYIQMYKEERLELAKLFKLNEKA